MKLVQFLEQARNKGGTTVPGDLDPLPLILTRVGLNRYSVKAQVLLRASLAVIACDDDLVESDSWALGADSRGLLNTLAARRAAGRYEQSYLETLARRLGECRQR